MLVTIVLGILIAAVVIWVASILFPVIGLGVVALVAYTFGREKKAACQPDELAKAKRFLNRFDQVSKLRQARQR